MGQRAGLSPAVNLDAERKAGELIRWAIANELVTAVHDVSDGGLLVAVAEMALAGNIGAHIVPEPSAEGRLTSQLFGENQGRYIVALADADDCRVTDRAKEQGLRAYRIGTCGGSDIRIGEGSSPHDIGAIKLADLRTAHEGFFPRLMGGDLTPEF